MAAVETRLACVACLVLLEEHEGVHGGVQQIMAEKAQRIGTPDAPLAFLQHEEGLLEGFQKLARLLVVHAVAQTMHRT